MKYQFFCIFKVQKDFIDRFTFTGFYEWCLHKYHSFVPKEIRVLWSEFNSLVFEMLFIASIYFSSV